MCSTVLNGAESTTFSLVVESIIKLILINDHARGERCEELEWCISEFCVNLLWSSAFSDCGPTECRHAYSYM